MGFSASAPCKAILFGEHYVVYGSPALAIAIEPRNSVLFGEAPEAACGILFHSGYGSGRISPEGTYSGPDELLIYPEVASKVFAGRRMPDCTAKFVSAWKLKGVGTSASLCAAFAAGMFRLAGKKASAEEIFAAAQAGDLVAHGGKASGIDAKTVSYGKPLVFRKSFSPPAFEGKPVGFVLPEGTALLLIDTNAGKKDGTQKMIQVFGKEFGITAPPQEVPGEKRGEVQEEYLQLWKKIEAGIADTDAKTLGALMDKNHALLKRRKVSSPGIEKAVSAALSAGAYGAKLTGGGGEGGAVLALVGKGGVEAVAGQITSSTGFSCYPVSLAGSGARVD